MMIVTKSEEYTRIDHDEKKKMMKKDEIKEREKERKGRTYVASN
jgi:hypothetical protein